MIWPIRKENEQKRNNLRLEHLIASLARGDVARLEEFYHLTRAAVFGLALSIVKNSHDAEDVTHETYVKVWEAAGTYEARGKPLAWVYTVTKNLALMKIRDRNKSDLFPENDVVNNTSNTPDYAIEDRIVLQSFLHELTDEEQNIVVLHAISGWKHKEIATFLNLPVQNIIVKYRRAIKKLIRKFEQQGLNSL